MAQMVEIPTTVEHIRCKMSHGGYRSSERPYIGPEFRRDLQNVFGTAGHPKADALWGLAWEYGHSGGANEILGFYIDLAELVK